jgi:hypothetical protein
MKPTNFSKAAVLMLIIVVAFAVCWEWYWRKRGFTIAYNDDKFSWAEKRKEIYKPSSQSTVFIGDSRMKFDLDIVTWEKLTGEQAVQLSFVGTSPRPILHDLAADEKFRGKLIINVNETVLFSVDSVRTERFAREGMEYFRNATPAQKASASINHMLESKLVFLEEGKFGLNVLLSELKLPGRKGVTFRPPLPKEYHVSDDNRQSMLTPMFLADTNLQNKKRQTWSTGTSLRKNIPIRGDTLEAYLKEIKTCTDLIKARGGIVVFVRTPSNGVMLEKEKREYPRKQYWERLLEYTGVPGYHYSDYPETAKLFCIEDSHLSPKDAALYTEQLVKILETKEGWTFPKPGSYNLKP